jgi:hypothetical protein
MGGPPPPPGGIPVFGGPFTASPMRKEELPFGMKPKKKWNLEGATLKRANWKKVRMKIALKKNQTWLGVTKLQT